MLVDLQNKTDLSLRNGLVVKSAHMAWLPVSVDQVPMEALTES